MLDHEFGLERDAPVVKIKQVDPEQELLESIIQEEHLRKRQKEITKAAEKRLGSETLDDLSKQEDRLREKVLHDIQHSNDQHISAVKYNTYFGHPKYMDLVSELGCEESTPMWVHHESWTNGDTSSLHKAGFSPVLIYFGTTPIENTDPIRVFATFEDFISAAEVEQPNVFLISDRFQVLLANVISRTQVHCALAEGMEFFGCHATAFVYETSEVLFPHTDYTLSQVFTPKWTMCTCDSQDDFLPPEKDRIFTEALPVLKSGIQTPAETRDIPPTDKRARKAYFRAQQKQELHLMNYARSLQGGGWFTTGSITAPAESKDNAKGKQPKGKPPKGKPPKPPKQTKADIIRAENTARLQRQAMTIELEKLVTRMSFCATPNEQIETLMDYIQNATQDFPRIQAQVYLLEVYSSMWAESFHAAKTLNRSPLDPRYGVIYAIGVVRLVYDLRGIIDSGILEKCMASLGFSLPETKNGPSTMKDLKIPNIPFRKVPIGMSFQRFQLAFCGGYMDRGSKTSPDPRIPFNPEPWQKDLLDIVDKKESVLVVAPTSAGKTFVSYYAMKKVLLEDDTGVIVYVAPTKALVHQVLAEVYSRFGKKNYATPGMRVFGSYLPEYNKHPFSCQVLVTIPSVLEAILLSPEHIEFVKNIRYVILDEVHCISALDTGKYWERIIALNTSPVVALSATIGNPDDLHQKIQQSQKVKTHLIVSQHRHSYLYHYEYNNTFAENVDLINSVHTNETGFVAVSAPKTKALTRIHPLSGRTSTTDISIDNIAPCDALDLADAIPDLPLCLTPEKFFADTTSLIDYPSCREYIQQLLDCISDPEPVFKKLTSAPMNGGRPDILKFAVTLNHHSLLPSIMFAFDRTDVNSAFNELLTALRAAEKNSSETGSSGNDTKEDKKQRKLQKLKERMIKKTESSRIADKDDPDTLLDADVITVNNQFSFVKTGHTHPDIELLLRPLAHVDGVTPDLIEGLRRGFGIHHDGVHTKYRQVVETLFRTKHLRIVFSTETLAIGINMPCRTAVFLKDSTSLNPVYYRQMSGRSGRRGFDLVGHVIFYDIPRAKQYRLMTSRLPNLVSHSPDSILLTLRKLALPGRVIGVDSGDPVETVTNVKYLIENLLVSPDGQPLGASGFTNVSNNEDAVISVLQAFGLGVFHDLTKDFDPTSPKEVFREMLVTLASKFACLRWPWSCLAVLDKKVVLYSGDTGVPVNAYILNFWEHTDNAFAAMTLENLIGTGEVWGLLKQFADILAAITKALEYRREYTSAIDHTDSEVQKGTSPNKLKETKQEKVVWNDSESDPDSVPDDWDAESDSDTSIDEPLSESMSGPSSEPSSEPSFSKLQKGTFTKEDNRVLTAFKLLTTDFTNKLKSYNFAGKNVFTYKKK